MAKPLIRLSEYPGTKRWLIVFPSPAPDVPSTGEWYWWADTREEATLNVRDWYSGDLFDRLGPP